MSREVKEAMLMFLEKFKKNGLANYQGDNVLQVSEEVLAICRRLASTRPSALTYEHVHGITQGLSICNNERFRTIFSTLAVHQELNNPMLPGIKKDSTPLEMIEAVFENGIDVYDAQCVADLWNPARKGGGGRHHSNAGIGGGPGYDVSKFECWNCGEKGHTVAKCPKPKNQELTTKNKKKYYEKKNKARGSNPQPAGNTNGQRQMGGEKWGDASKLPPGTELVNGCLMVSCKKCGLNQTHSTKYHKVWNANKANFCLSASHPYRVALARNGQAGQAGPPPPVAP